MARPEQGRVPPGAENRKAPNGGAVEGPAQAEQPPRHDATRAGRPSQDRRQS
ncbi:hypothetical protein QM467_04735 [Rhodoblastus sp. 17X3]|uniref:hypothetical protein n=1 Tax=Rhodoblastus sp. 17X3 TaxID=3047026 RepID=UPI0024B67597|nr:hypothetical protein [Rhodoblastus sp. 17X3]MDI9847366.1 hypothetical protein [Rhodoblastus sp. 17X3]